MNRFFANLKKGYNRPVSMPIWKWLIVSSIWIMCVLFYILSMIKGQYFIILALLSQITAILLTYAFDTGNWRNTEKGKQFVEKYENN